VRSIFAFSYLSTVGLGVPLDGVSLVVGQYFPDSAVFRVFPYPSSDRGNEFTRKVTAHFVERASKV